MASVPNEVLAWMAAMIEAMTIPMPPDQIKELAKRIVTGNPEVFPGGWKEKDGDE